MFKFELKQVVTISESGENGKVIGRAEYDHCDNCYLVRYQAKDGRCVENWWTESALEA
jgi:hypothetical protein